MFSKQTNKNDRKTAKAEIPVYFYSHLADMSTSLTEPNSVPKHNFFQQVWSRCFEQIFPRSLSFDFSYVMSVCVLFTIHFIFADSPLPIYCLSFVGKWIAVALNVTSCLFPFSFFPWDCTMNKCNTFCQWHYGGQEPNKILWSILFGTDCSSEVNIFYEAIILKRIPSTTKLRLLLSLKKLLFFLYEMLYSCSLLYESILLRTEHVQGNKQNEIFSEKQNFILISWGNRVKRMSGICHHCSFRKRVYKKLTKG